MTLDPVMILILGAWTFLRLSSAVPPPSAWRTSPCVINVRPATVLAWHRKGFQLYWRWKSRRRSMGRPPLDIELRTLIRRMARENPTWGRRRIQAELPFLGYEIAELTIAQYLR